MNHALHTARILLPSTAPEQWAVVACDQFTAQPEYWEKAESVVGSTPSTLRITLPEIWLNERAERVPEIHRTMRRYLDSGVLTEAVNGFVLVERITESGVRPGLLVALDLEAYDYHAGSDSLIRATERTVLERVPPRAEIRASAPVELPHVMMLIDDPACTVIEPLYNRRQQLRSLYDFELMLEGGHLRGWTVEGAETNGVFAAIDALAQNCGGLLYAVGDGNHSLAAARQCWLNLRETLSESERENHPARYALVELVNLACPCMVFEPIHRVLFNVCAEEVMDGYRSYLRQHGVDAEEGRDVIAIDGSNEWGIHSEPHPIHLLQSYLDEYLSQHPEAEIDYIHGEAALRELVSKHPNSIGFMPRAFDKSELFPTIRQYGVLPRKTFSIGEATEKRYYMEARKIL